MKLDAVLGNDKWSDLKTVNDGALLRNVLLAALPLQIVVSQQTAGVNYPLNLEAASTPAGIEILLTNAAGNTVTMSLNKLSGETNAQCAARIQKVLGITQINQKAILTFSLYDPIGVGDGNDSKINLISNATANVPATTMLFEHVTGISIKVNGVTYVVVESTNITKGSETVTFSNKHISLIGN